VLGGGDPAWRRTDAPHPHGARPAVLASVGRKDEVKRMKDEVKKTLHFILHPFDFIVS
jgi:hypothetical protein